MTGTTGIPTGINTGINLIDYSRFRDKICFLFISFRDNIILVFVEIYMKRKIYDKLLSWKNTDSNKTALLIDGARRVGKSYIAEEFAKKEYRSYILIDFYRAPREVKVLFDNYLNDLDALFINEIRLRKATQPTIGLKLNRDHSTMKLYMADTGLLISHSFDENGLVSNEILRSSCLENSR